MGNQSLRLLTLALFAFSAFSTDGFGMPVVKVKCEEAVLESAVPFETRIHRTVRDHASEPKILITVEDPHHHFQDLKYPLFHWALLDEGIRARLLYLHKGLLERQQKVIVHVGYGTMRFEYKHDRQQSDVHGNSLSHIRIRFNDEALSESSEMMFVGLVMQLFLEELRTHFTSEPTLADDWNQIPENIQDIMILRSVWLTKFSFYEGQRGDLSREFRKNPKGAADFESYVRSDAGFYDHYMESLVRSGAGDFMAPGQLMRNDLQLFYGFDPALVQRAWEQPFPNGWEFAIANPDNLVANF